MKCKKKNTRIFIKVKEDMAIKWKHHETLTQLNVNSDVYKYMNIYLHLDMCLKSWLQQKSSSDYFYL